MNSNNKYLNQTLNSRNSRIESEDAHSTVYIDNMLNNQTEWRNVNEIVKQSIKALLDVIKTQSINIKELEKHVNNKASKSELNSGLAIKANQTELMKRIDEIYTELEKKVTYIDCTEMLNFKLDKSELEDQLNKKANIEEITNFLNKRDDNSKYEIYNKLNNKFNDLDRDVKAALDGVLTIKDLELINEQLGNFIK